MAAVAASCERTAARQRQCLVTSGISCAVSISSCAAMDQRSCCVCWILCHCPAGKHQSQPGHTKLKTKGDTTLHAPVDLHSDSMGSYLDAMSKTKSSLHLMTLDHLAMPDGICFLY